MRAMPTSKGNRTNCRVFMKTEIQPGGLGTHMAVLLNIAVISASFPIGEAITLSLEPAALNCVRFAFAAAAFAVILTVRGEWRRPGLRDGLRYLVLATSLIGFFIAMFASLRLTTAINTSALFTLVPLFSAAFAWPLLGQKTPPRQLALMGLAAIGALWVVFKGSVSAAMALRLGQGDLIFIAGCVSLAAFSPLTRRLDVGENLLSQMFWILLTATALLAVIGATDLAVTDWQTVSEGTWAGIAYLAVFTTALSFYLVNYASLRLPSAKVMAYSYLTPSFVVLMEALRTGSPPAPMVLTGAVITALATLLLQLSTSLPRIR